MQARPSTPERSMTWPSTLHAAPKSPPRMHKAQLASFSTVPYGEHRDKFFDDDLENNPENYFLSPVQMYEYEDWAEDSDSDADEVEWDAGITDFALFDADRRQALEGDRPLPSKWGGMLSQQASALQRAVKRNRADSDPARLRPTPALEHQVPSLTPDTSPDLRDDLDVESYHGQSIWRPSVPNYLTVIVTPPDEDEDDYEAIEEDENLPLSFYVSRKQQRSLPNRKLQRPGLKHSRTLSGKVHTWRRPSMYTVGEDLEAEERAEQEDDGAVVEKNLVRR